LIEINEMIGAPRAKREIESQQRGANVESHILLAKAPGARRLPDVAWFSFKA
jgi:hypothetical protein